MLRLILVILIIGAGMTGALLGPFYALLFYLWNAYFRPEHWTYGGLVGSLRLSLVIGVVLLIRTAIAAPRLAFNLRTALVFLFLAQMFLATLASEHPDPSWSLFPDFAKVLVITYLIVVLVDDAHKIRTTMLVIALSLGLEGAKQGWATTILHPGAKNANTIPFLGDNNGVAVGMMMLVPIFNTLAATATSRWERLAHRFMAVGVFLRGITTYSRGGFLAAGVVGVLTLARSKHKLRALVGIAAVVFLVNSVMPETFWARMDTITASPEDRDASAAGRLHFWSVALSMAMARPLYGVGPNSFSPSYWQYDPAETPIAPATHSSWFGALAELGFPGLLLLAANVGLAFVGCWRVAHRKPRNVDDERLATLANGMMTSIAAYAVAGSFLSQQYSEMVWHFIGLSTAIGLVAQRSCPAPDEHRVPVARPARTSALLALPNRTVAKNGVGAVFTRGGGQ
jgi:probable O-glycosylation ligase (exosortase A-associated)